MKSLIAVFAMIFSVNAFARGPIEQIANEIGKSFYGYTLTQVSGTTEKEMLKNWGYSLNHAEKDLVVMAVNVKHSGGFSYGSTYMDQFFEVIGSIKDRDGESVFTKEKLLEVLERTMVSGAVYVFNESDSLVCAVPHASVGLLDPVKKVIYMIDLFGGASGGGC